LPIGGRRARDYAYEIANGVTEHEDALHGERRPVKRDTLAWAECAGMTPRVGTS